MSILLSDYAFSPRLWNMLVKVFIVHSNEDWLLKVAGENDHLKKDWCKYAWSIKVYEASQSLWGESINQLSFVEANQSIKKKAHRLGAT